MRPGAGDKRAASLDAAIAAAGARDGMTVSFHHHLRNGDAVLNLVMARLAAMGLADLHLAPTSLFPVHAPLAEHIRTGTVTRLSTAYMAGPAADAVAEGALAHPARLTSHGGRAEALRSGALPVDIAFVAAPAADGFGNLSGTEGPNACGPLGYPRVDVRHARHVIAVTDTLRPFPLGPWEIGGDDVDAVIEVPSIGEAAQIASGTTRPTTDPEGLKIAALAAEVIAASGALEDGFSFQTGAGGVSLAVAETLGRIMAERGVTGSFAAGGITGTLVDLFHAGLFRALLDVQCFDLAAVRSYREDARHFGMSAAAYAAPRPRGSVADRLGAVILGAAEVDAAFNVNVTTAADGRIIGGSGGHADTAEGAGLTVVTTRLRAGPYAKLVPHVGHVTTPGRHVDVVATEIGAAVNPARPELAARLAAAGLPVRDISEMIRAAGDGAAPPRVPDPGAPVVAVSTDRHGQETGRVCALR